MVDRLTVRNLVLSTLTIALCACLISSAAIAADPHDFRNSHWYDTIQEVKKNETAEFIEHRTKEMNVAVDPPKPFSANNLYFRYKLLEREVLILYEFELDCNQLVRAAYIFPLVLSEREVDKISRAISEKYDIEPNEWVSEYDPQKLFIIYRLPETSININRVGGLHIFPDRTWVKYATRNWSWLGGWNKGTEPSCPVKDREVQRLKKKL